MVICGAPLIGATAGYGMALASRQDASDEALERAYAMLLATRPTAINLKWALDEIVAVVRNRSRAERTAAAYRRAAEICEDDIAINSGIGQSGLPLIEAIAAKKQPGERVNVLTHCNAGWLATGDWGTALAPLYAAKQAGVAVHVWVDETRPRNQGTLTAWELNEGGVPHTLIADNAGGLLMQRGQVDACIVGADRIAANGDVCNKVGTYLKALAAHDNQVPFYVAAPPCPTIDLALPGGWADIPIEERSGDEVRDHDRAHRRRPHRDRAYRPARHAGRELRVRRHAGAAGDRADHRARRARRLPRGLGEGFPRARRRGRMTGLSPFARSRTRRNDPMGSQRPSGLLRFSRE